MNPSGEEAKLRIERHRAARENKGFVSIERYTGLEGLAGTLPQGCAVLLECVANLLANEIFDVGGNGKNAVTAGIRALRERAELLLVVTNEIGADGAAYEAQTRDYQLALGEINRTLAAESDQFVEMAAGLPLNNLADKVTAENSYGESKMVLVIGALGAGKREYVNGNFSGANVLWSLHELVRSGKLDTNSDAEFERLLAYDVIVCDEVGLGVVPLDPVDRKFRDDVGRLCCRLAANAGQVIRVVCGIPQTLINRVEEGDFK
jgi:adenosylcobinamide kinase/adenosylcobinamide-phosphate guanylyltransferase